MTQGATLKPKVAMYLDRNGSVLGSLAIGSPRGMSSWVTANLYPGVVHIGSLAPGYWLQVVRDGGVRVGVTSSWGIGLAGGSAR